MEVEPTLKILATGNKELPEFQNALSRLQHFDFEFVEPTQIEALIDQQFDLLIMFVDRSQAIASELVTKWNELAPFLPFVAVHSSHGEGEVRSGSPWPGVIRVYWHKWAFQFENFLNQKSRGLFTNWNRPKTSTLVDHRLDRNKDESTCLRLQIAVSTKTKIDFDLYEQDFSLAGCRSTWLEHAGDDLTPDAIVIDENSLTLEAQSRIQSIVERFPRVPTVLTLGYPRFHEILEAQDLGIGTVLSKPFDDGELRWAVEQRVGTVCP